MAVSLRNRLGIDQAAPTEFVGPGADGKPALRPGVEIRLWYNEIAPEIRLISDREPGPPVQLNPTRDARITPGDATRTLGPAESFEAFRLDLRDWYDVSRPGQYRLEVIFNADSGIVPSNAGQLYFILGE